MEPSQTIEAEEVALERYQPHGPPHVTQPSVNAMTPAQAKVDAIASLTLSAYQKASQLELTDEEIEKLTAEFPDEAFKAGAAGKENLIYIEHAYLRDRLNEVFKPGRWAIVPRNRWAEEFTTSNGKPASRVYVEAMLCIRGCFAAEAVGEMEYYPHNAGQNYGDAVEGAKTAALRRCCKELGIGLQAWKKDWCEGWWQRKRPGNGPSKPVSRPLTPRAQAKAAEPQKAPEATGATRKWFIAKFLSKCDREQALNWLINQSWILPNEGFEDIPLPKVPTSKEQAMNIVSHIEANGTGKANVTERGFEDYGDVNYDDKPTITETPLANDGLVAQGFIKIVNTKATKKSPRYTILLVQDMEDKVGGEWFATFSSTLHQVAEANKGKYVTIRYKATGFGNDILDNGIEV